MSHFGQGVISLICWHIYMFLTSLITWHMFLISLISWHMFLTGHNAAAAYPRIKDLLSPSSKVIEDKSTPLRPCVTCLHNVLMKNWQKTKKTKGNGSDDFYLIQIDVSLWSSHLYSIFSVMKTAELKKALYLNDLPIFAFPEFSEENGRKLIFCEHQSKSGDR